MIMAILAIILTLILVIGIHEAGHALVARLFKIKIKRVAIGFGRPLMQWTGKNGCEWVLGMWFLGGYVHLANTRIGQVDPKDYDTCFDKKPIWQRVLVLLAGAFANIITAWIGFVLVFFIGVHYKVPRIESVAPNSIAAKAGVLPGDQFFAIDGYGTPNWQEVGKELIISWGSNNVPVSVIPANSHQIKELSFDLSQTQFTTKNHSLLAGIGISPDLSVPLEEKRFASLSAAISQANQEISHLLYFFIMILKQLFSGLLPFSVLLGPVGLFAASIASLSQGIVVFLYFIASLSVAVALVNLIPIPGLDGGSILYALIEKCRGKPISVAWELLIYRLMLVVAFIALAHLVNNDLARFHH